MTITWNPSDKTAGLTLSNGDLKATKTTALSYENVRATVGYNSGKYYWELTVGDPSSTISQDWYLGVRDVSESISTVGIAGLSAGYRPNPSNGSVARIAVDFDNSKIWVALDAGAWLNGGGDPETGTDPTGTIPGGGTDWRPWYGTDNMPSSLDSYTTANFVGPFVYSVPIGFDPFEPAAFSVTSISPEVGSTSGGTPVTITGIGFDLAATATIDGNQVTDLVVVGSTTITGVTPAGTVGAKDVVVTNP